MKKTIISALLLIAGQLLHAQLKFDWAASFGNTSTEVLNDAVLYGGKYYVAGYFTGTLDLNPGPGVFQITSANGKNNAFLACYTADGQFIRGAGFTGNGTSNILKIQAEGSLLILGGNVTGSIDFDPGSGTSNYTTTGNSTDAFVVCVDSQFQFKWANTTSAKAGATVVTGGLAVDGKNSRVYLGGYFSYIVDFDASAAVEQDTSFDSYSDCFLATYNLKTGQYIGSYRLKGPNQQLITGMAADTAGNVYIAGMCTDSFDVQGGPVVKMHKSRFQQEGFILKYNNAGNCIWNWAYGMASTIIRGLETDADGNVSYWTSNDFGELNPAGQVKLKIDGDVNIQTLTRDENRDFWIALLPQKDDDTDPGNGISPALKTAVVIAHLDDSANLISAHTYIQACNVKRLIAEKNGVFAAGIFADSMDMDAGAGKYMLRSSSSNFDVFLYHQKSAAFRQVSYQKSFCNRDTFTLGGVQFKVADAQLFTTFRAFNPPFTISVTGESSTGGDSVTVWHVDHNYQNKYLTKTRDSIICNSPKSDWQWMNCDDKSWITGETNRWYVPASSGNYQVRMQLNNCVDTSNCVNFVFNSILQPVVESADFYPNPSDGYIFFTQNAVVTGKICNETGQEIMHFSGNRVNTAVLPVGLYLVQWTAEGREYHKKLLIQR